MTDAMQPVLTAAAQREADRRTIEEFGLPGATLMENAGRGAAATIAQQMGPVRGKTIVVLCGKGNNGGDGFVIAQRLYACGARVRVLAASPASDMTPDAALNWRLLEKLRNHDTSGRLRLERYARVEKSLPPADLYVDALLGTGLSSPVREPLLGMVASLNAQPAPVVAIDIPTGLHADHGTVLGSAVKATLTITMGTLKAGLLLNDGPDLAGRTEVIDIGIPGFISRDVGKWPGCAYRTTDAGVSAWLPRRDRLAHKYSAGAALVIGGTPGLAGAPVMASLATARVGAGYVTCAAGQSVRRVLAEKMTEIVTVALPETHDGGIDGTKALVELAPHLDKAKALLIGPGLGRLAGTQDFVCALLRTTDLPAVVDADALYALSSVPDTIARYARGRWILTPHAGEFQRLAGAAVDLTGRISLASSYAQRWNCILVLKGMPSIIAAPEGTAYVNGTGGPALATAGTGDILAGLCAGLLAQGLSPVRAAVCAAHLGGAAADRYTERRGQSTMMAMDLLMELPEVRKERFE